jgi:hypothetical protein
MGNAPVLYRYYADVSLDPACQGLSPRTLEIRPEEYYTLGSDGEIYSRRNYSFEATWKDIENLYPKTRKIIKDLYDCKVLVGKYGNGRYGANYFNIKTFKELNKTFNIAYFMPSNYTELEDVFTVEFKEVQERLRLQHEEQTNKIFMQRKIDDELLMKKLRDLRT